VPEPPLIHLQEMARAALAEAGMALAGAAQRDITRAAAEERTG